MQLKDDRNFYKVDLINNMSLNMQRQISESSEEHYHKQLSGAVAAAESKHIVMLAGPSASGKTTTAMKLKAEFIACGRDADVVSLDDFYKNRSTLPLIDGERNAEVIEALEVTMIREAISYLLQYGETSIPEYDFISGTRTDNAAYIKMKKNGVVIIEGIHALNEEMRKSLPHDEILNVYASPHSGFSLGNRICLTKRQTRLIRRMVRDSWSRGSTADDTLKMWAAVCKGEDLYIRPSAKYADYRIDSTYAFEPCLFKKEAQRLLADVPESSYYFTTAQSLSKRLDNFVEFDSAFLSESSLLREFFNSEKM